MTRRTFIQLCTSVLLALGLGRYIPASATGRTIRFPRQIITQDSATSRTVMWQADGPVKDAVFRLTSPNGMKQIHPESNTLVQDNDTTTCYTVRLTGLKSGTHYEGTIQMGGEEIPLPINTASSRTQTFQALLVCDSQCGETYETFRQLLTRAFARHPEAAFLADIGDLTDNGQSSWHWNSFLSVLTDSPARAIPFVPVMGNHECYGLDWQFALPRRYLATFSLPDNGSRAFSGYYYSFDYGPAHFIVLNTQIAELDKLKPGLLQEELLWLRQDAAVSKKSWKIVLMHKDILAYDEYQPGTGHTGGISDVGHAFMQTFEQLGIDLVLTGHMHTYRNRGHIRAGKPAEDGPLYIMSGPSGNEQYTVPADPLYDRKAIAQPTRENYLLLEVTPHTLQISDYTVDGTEIDRSTLTKE